MTIGRHSQWGGGGSAKNPLVIEKLPKTPFPASQDPPSNSEAPGQIFTVFRVFKGNFVNFSALIMINNWV